MSTKNSVSELFDKIRYSKPLVHSITNYVTVNDCANVLLAIGASPIMADDEAEVEEIVGISNALVINIGTLNKRTVESMLKAGKMANKIGVPVVFDPVGAGASTFRNETTRKLLKNVKFAIIRGNLSEMSFVAGVSSSTHGVDVSEKDMSNDANEVAQFVAKQYDTVCAITGAVDVVSDGKRLATLHNGTPMLSNVTGTGCMTSALLGAFVSASEDTYIATIAGISAMSIAGELADLNFGKKGTGSFHIAIINYLSKMNSLQVEMRLNINE